MAIDRKRFRESRYNWPEIASIRSKTGGAPPWSKPFSTTLLRQIQRAHELMPGPKTWAELKDIVDFLGGPDEP